MSRVQCRGVPMVRAREAEDPAARPPFAGLRIVELGGAVPAAAATKRFSDLGADVVKVEPPGGAALRRLRPFPEDRPHSGSGTFHVALDTGKRSLLLDTGTPSGREVLQRLATRADLVVSDLPATRARALRALFGESEAAPSLITITPHGLEGPFAGRLENDASLFGWSTRAFNQRPPGAPERGPLRYAPFLAEVQVGCTAAAVAAAVVWARRRDGIRRVVDLSAVEALTGNVDSTFFLHAMTGTAQTYPRPGATGARTYGCLDGHVLMLQVDREPALSRVRAVVGAHETEADGGAPVEDLLRPWLAARTKQEAFEAFQEGGVIAAPILDASELLSDPQAVARGSYVRVPHPTLGETTIAGPPFRVAAGGDALWEARPAPAPGQHTVAILGELGYTPAEQVALTRAGVTL